MGGANYISGTSSQASSYVNAPDTITPINGRPLAGLFKYYVREATWGVVYGYTGSEPILRPSVQSEADIEAYEATMSPADRVAMVIMSPNKGGASTALQEKSQK